MLVIALWIAISAHAVAWFYWHPVQKITAPELPDWINITLVAGLEEQAVPKPRVKPASKPKPAPIQKQPVKQELVEKNRATTATEQQPEAIEQETETASATTFVQADSKPFAMNNPRPVYPASARRRGMQGMVLLQVNVSPKGKVTGIHVMRSSGFRVLDVAALNSVKQWRFMPARKGDVEVASTVQVPVRFILQ